MKASEIRELTAEELQSKLKALKEELFNLRFQLAINQLDNPMRIKAVKKDIARVYTVIQEQVMDVDELNKLIRDGRHVKSNRDKIWDEL